MPMRLIVEVLRRGATNVFSVGQFTDDFIAKQVIDRLYEEVRQISFRPERIAYDVPEGMWEAIDADGWDVWATNNRNSPTPLFYAVKRSLWNSVPTGVQGFTVYETGDNFTQFPGDVPNVIASVEPSPTVTNG